MEGDGRLLIIVGWGGGTFSLLLGCGRFIFASGCFGRGGRYGWYGFGMRGPTVSPSPHKVGYTGLPLKRGGGHSTPLYLTFKNC